MNSYNENLHDNVVTSLQNQEIDQKKLKAQWNAAMFTLYYSEGAKITAAEKLKTATKVLKDKAAVKKQAVDNSNISNNLLGAANQASQYLKQSVTNTAVAASNIQIASNAIVRLAGDVGTIFSILNAADFDTEIYAQCKDVYSKMNETAYHAELASQIAMEGSVFTSEVSSPTLASEAKNANDAISNLLKIAATEFDTASGIVASDNSTLAATRKAAKMAEGNLEDIDVEYLASQSAYELNNKELNFNLQVTDQVDSSYTVSFTPFTSPFSPPQYPVPPAGYPVKNYNIMLVKDSRKSVFSVSNAESLLLDESNPFIQLGPEQTSAVIKTNELLDSDGDPLVLGTNYVVFVLTTLLEDYKKYINNFYDYLSAPSATFLLTTPLTVVKTADILPVSSSSPQSVGFSVIEEKDGPDVEFRCMFLPHSTAKDLLTVKGLSDEEYELEEMRIHETFEPQLLGVQSTIDTLQQVIAETKVEEDALKAKKNSGITGEDLEKVEEQLKVIKAKMKELKQNSDDANNQFKQLKDDKAAANTALHARPKAVTVPIEFFFNLDLALQVPAGSYYTDLTPVITDIPNTSAIAGAKPTSYTFSGKIEIGSNTTDNFGNALIDGQSYIPVFLTVCTEGAKYPEYYSPVLSDISEERSFKYSQAKYLQN